jgi:phosphatidylinositol alpha-1,6-mannosyltransferase
VRALVLTPDFPPAPGGIQLVMSRLVANLPETDTRVVTLAFDGAEPEPLTGVDVVAAGSWGSRGNKISNARLNATGLWHGVRFRPDVVVSGHAVTAPAASAVRLVTRAPVIQYVHADEARQRPRLLSFAVRRADAVVAVSSHARDLAVRAGCEPGRVRVVHPGVDTPRNSPGSRAEQPTILTVARLSAEHKGHDMIIRALPAIRARVPDVRWVVVGGGRLQTGLEELATSLGVRDAIRFEGRISDSERDRWLDSAHVFAMPSRVPPNGVGGEGFGIVYLEAGIHGLPVVAGAQGGALDAVVHGETGLLVDPNDIASLADAIVGLLLDPERAARLGEQGAEHAKQFTWEGHASAVEDLTREVARK